MFSNNASKLARGKLLDLFRLQTSVISDTSNSQSGVSTKHVCLQHVFALAVAAAAAAAQRQYQTTQSTLCNPLPIIHPC